jgi:hypothetical protein
VAVLKGSSGSVFLMNAEGDDRPTDDEPLGASPRTSVNSMSLWDGLLDLDVISPDREAWPDGGGFSGEVSRRSATHSWEVISWMDRVAQMRVKG